MNEKKGKLSTIILVIVMVIGLSLLLYPSVSDYWNSTVQSYAVSDYIQEVAVLDNNEYEELWNTAAEFNQSLLNRNTAFALNDQQKAAYGDMLNPGGSGIMCYIEIPSINISLPIYHGTDDSILQVAIGHLSWSSLPVGGASTHCVISGHRGLPSARLFTDLDKLVVGDIFMLHVLDETLTYEVDQIRIVEPHETEELTIQEGKDLCTMFTCTPYGINSHRLLVRGHRIENIEQAQTVRVTADAVIIEKLVVVPFVLAPILLCMLLALMIQTSKKRRRNDK